MTLKERAERIIDELAAHSESMTSAVGRQVETVVVGPEIVRATLIDIVEKHLKQVIKEAGQEGEADRRAKNE